MARFFFGVPFYPRWRGSVLMHELKEMKIVIFDIFNRKIKVWDIWDQTHRYQNGTPITVNVFGSIFRLKNQKRWDISESEQKTKMKFPSIPISRFSVPQKKNLAISTPQLDLVLSRIYGNSWFWPKSRELVLLAQGE